jgi:ABC-2 type transport system permease protein
MIKALFKKQMMEVFSWVYRDKKSGKNRSGAGIIAYALLYLMIFGCLGGVFYFAANILCEPLVSAGLGWLYFAVMGLIALFMGVFGSVFNTYASLYNAKDNDLLLSMPIPAAKILLIRLSGVYAMGLMYELIVMIPALIVWFTAAGINIASVICTLLIPLVLSVLVLVLSAVLGWVVALVAGKLKRKNIIVVILSLAFIAAYYYFYANAYAILQSVLVNPQALGDRVKSILYPFYHMGLAAEGRLVSMLIFTAIVGALFGIVYLVLSCSFLKIATENRGTAAVKYREQRTAVHSVGRALFYKELRRFLGSANYMLNCGLGIIIMPVCAGALIWKQATIRQMMFEIFSVNEGIVFLIAAGAVCMMASMNDITAPSVSLEGKNLWLMQAYPVSAGQALMAKLQLHLVLTLIPAAVAVAAVEWVLKPDIGFAVLIPAVTALFVLFMAAFGLFINLKMPNLNWTSEIIPIKQSMGVMIALFGGWAAVAAFGAAYYFLSAIISPLVYLICAAALLAAGSAGLICWLRTKGAEIFERL